MNNDEKILIVDDDLIFLTYLTRKLSDKFNIFTADSGERGLELLESESPFALVAVDYLMDKMNGVEFIDKVHMKYPDTICMMVTGVTDLQSVMDIINNVNIFRIICKPSSDVILGDIIDKGIEQYKLVQSEKKKKEDVDAANKQLIQYAKALNEIVTSLKNKNRELNEAYFDTIQRLVIASEYKDEDTHDHILRMSRYSALIAGKLGFPAEDVENMLYASPMHDIGKIGIPDAVLMKPSKLTTEEFELIKTHTLIGSKILEGSKAGILKLAAKIAISHHERWNGKGYPYGYSGNNIPLEGRIVALADTFDALSSRRPYKNAYPADVVYDMIKKERGEQFEPAIVDIFTDNYDEFILIQKEVSESGGNAYNNYTRSERDEDDSDK